MSFDSLVNQNIVNILDLQILNEKDRVGIISKISNLVQKKIIIRIIEFLDEQNVNLLAQLLNTEENDQEILGFLDDKVPHLEEIVFSEVNKMKKELADYIK